MLEVHLSVVWELRAARELYMKVGFVENEIDRETLKDGCILCHMVKLQTV